MALELMPYPALLVGVLFLVLTAQRWTNPLQAVVSLIGVALVVPFGVSGLGWTVAGRPRIGASVFMIRSATMLVVASLVPVTVPTAGNGGGVYRWTLGLAGFVVFLLPLASAIVLSSRGLRK